MKNPLRRNKIPIADESKDNFDQGVRFCTKCGTELPTNAKFSECDNCRGEKAKLVMGIVGIVGAALGAAIPFVGKNGKSFFKKL